MLLDLLFLLSKGARGVSYDCGNSYRECVRVCFWRPSCSAVEVLDVQEVLVGLMMVLTKQ